MKKINSWGCKSKCSKVHKDIYDINVLTLFMIFALLTGTDVTSGKFKEIFVHAKIVSTLSVCRLL